MFNVFSMAKTKNILINLRISEDVREDFRVVAELRGSTISGLLHQFIVKSIREEKDRDLRVFTQRREENDRQNAQIPETQSKEEIERSLGLKQAQITHINNVGIEGKAKDENPQKSLLATENAVNPEKNLLTKKAKQSIITQRNKDITDSPSPGRQKIVMKQARYSARQEPDIIEDEEAA
jgi:antitoxin component of RelBE/YafQ-DinJ toxin-antitoxin module